MHELKKFAGSWLTCNECKQKKESDKEKRQIIKSGLCKSCMVTKFK